MTKYKLEYIWLDGYTPVPNLRGKTQIKEFDSFPTLEQLPLWGFDGSSTMQAEAGAPPSPAVRRCSRACRCGIAAQRSRHGRLARGPPDASCAS